MAKSRKTASDSFSYGEKALAGPLSKSAFQHIYDHGFISRASDIRVVKRIATIGAFMAAGTPLVIAARIAHALSAEFDDGDPPSGLKRIAEKEATAEEIASLPAEPNDFWYHSLILRAEERQMREFVASAKKVTVESIPPIDYWEHVARRGEGRYYAGLVPAMQSDVRIEICDRRHVFMWPTSRLKSFGEDREFANARRAAATRNPQAAPMIEEPGFVGWIEGWERGNQASFKHVSEIIQLSPNDEPHRSKIARLKADLGEAKYQEWCRSDADERWRANAARLQAMAAQEVLNNAVGKLTVNVSLAIRRALDRIAEHRANKSRRRVD